jgi:hypothetical protein
MSKKGISFTFAALLGGILMLIVLFVLGSMFNVGVSTIFSKFMGITDSAEAQAKGDSCRNVGEKRSCQETSCDSGYTEVSGTWSDCPPKDKSGEPIKGKENRRYCCQQIETDSTE